VTAGLSGGAGVVTHAFTETIAKGENASHFTHEKRYAIQESSQESDHLQQQ